MNAHSNLYYIVRAIVRFAVGTLFTVALMIGIPAAVDAVWPALILAAILWGIVLYPYIKLVLQDSGYLRSNAS